MKTLLISEIFPPQHGGSGRWFWEIFRRFQDDQFVIAAGEAPSHASFDQEHDLDIARMPLRMSAWGLRSVAGLKGYLRSYRQLSQLMRSRQATHVQAARCLPEGVMALSLKLRFGLPYICYVHGEDVNSAARSRELSFLVRQVFKSASLIIANSRNTERILSSDWNLPATKLRLLYPGVDIGKFVPATRCAATRARLGWDDRPVILTVGRLQQRKGHDQLIRALPRIREQFPRVLYAIVGDGDMRATLEALSKEVGVAEHVQFCGAPHDGELVERYQQCDLFALPNREINGDIEGFGMVLLEAQACGKPVVAGASGGTAETMRVPETGRIVPCEGPELLAETVIELLANPELRATMGHAARDWVEKQFSWETLSRQAGDLFGIELR